ncbi:hypothetical protein MNBD_GAMMA25-42 [hydrothermal vent metagenome]|uniref:Glycosyltransferase RgtA/B/C/D-like domain-containing protein n=1 Tax=hydrothermal vent metagenome TaxID=652676 RepID=A0A3B1BFV6_9ZZZZ
MKISMLTKENAISLLDDPKSFMHLFALAICFGLGLWLRYYGYWAGESFHIFAINDEVSAFRVAMQFLAGEEQAFYLGQPNFSEGHAPGPAWTLFWVGLLKLGKGSIENALLFVALLNSLLVLLVYVFARQLLSPGYALLSCFLFAISPWPVHYALGLWNPVPLALLGVFLFITLWQVTQFEHSRAIFWVCVISAVIPHFHMIGIFYYPAILLVLYLTRVRLNRFWFILGILAGVLIYFPYIMGEIRHDWENTRLILNGGSDFSFSVLKIISGPVTVLSNHPGRWLGDGLEGLLGFGDKWFISRYVLLGVNIISLVLALAIVTKFTMHFFSLCRLHWKHPSQMLDKYPVYSFVGILFFLPLLLFALTGHNYSTRYTILIFPLIFILPALYIKLSSHNKLKRFYLSSLPWMSVFSVYLLVSFYTHMSYQIEGDEYFINSFKKMEQIRETIKHHAGTNSRVQLVIDDYIGSAPERLRISTVAMADYLDIYETYLTNFTADSKTKTKTKSYILRAENDVLAEDLDAAYRANGIVIYPVR